MSDYQVGQLIQKRCMDCCHDKFTITNVIQKDFKEKVVYELWGQCPECGINDSKLVPENL